MLKVGLPLLLLGIRAHAGPIQKIVLEAENCTALHAPLRRMEAKASNSDRHGGQGYLQMAWNKNHLAGEAAYRFRVPYSGSYYVWLRTQWQGPESNRIYVAVNGGHPRYVGEDATYGSWHWVSGVRRQMRVRCEAGMNTLVLQDMDMGVRIDQILLTDSRDYWPTGVQ